MNEGVKHNLNSKVKVVTKKIDELKVLGKGIVDATEHTNEVTPNLQYRTCGKHTWSLSRVDEFLSQKVTVLNINDELIAQLQNQISPDPRQNLQTIKLSSIEIKSFNGEFTEWPSVLDSDEVVIDNSSNLSNT